jgi:hypothetical protein
MKAVRTLEINSIDQFSGESVSWEMEGVDATYLGKIAVIVIVAIIVL